MNWVYPPVSADGWHIEVDWNWRTFGLIVCLAWGESLAFRLGWLAVVLWRFDTSDAGIGRYLGTYQGTWEPQEPQP